MPRRPRIDVPGYHHIVNRGVNRTNIFSDPDDKEKFLQILCKACRVYSVIVHDYCLMDNHYHILIENSQTNLSLFMRQINSNYAIYFNKKLSTEVRNNVLSFKKQKIINTSKNSPDFHLIHYATIRKLFYCRIFV